jgi:hypothetical protein
MVMKLPISIGIHFGKKEKRTIITGLQLSFFGTVGDKHPL